MSKAFIFLDRDGTLVRDPGYVHRLEDYALLDGVVEGLQLLRDAGYRFAILTNQSGIGRGHFGESDFTRFQGHLVRDLGSQDIKIEGTFHCPHGPEDGCSCRKPSAGLLRKAQAEFGADLSRSWMLGDSEAGKRLACLCGRKHIHRLTTIQRFQPSVARAARSQRCSSSVT